MQCPTNCGDIMTQQQKNLGIWVQFWYLWRNRPTSGIGILALLSGISLYTSIDGSIKLMMPNLAYSSATDFNACIIY